MPQRLKPVQLAASPSELLGCGPGLDRICIGFEGCRLKTNANSIEVVVATLKTRYSLHPDRISAAREGLAARRHAGAPRKGHRGPEEARG